MRRLMVSAEIAAEGWWEHPPMTPEAISACLHEAAAAYDAECGIVGPVATIPHKGTVA
jgi:hypothetical protein